MRKSTTYNKVVNYNKEENEVTILGEIFEFSDNTRGATRTVYKIMTKEKYTERLNEYLNNPEAVVRYLEDESGENPSYRDVIVIANNKEEIEQEILKISFNSQHLDEIRKELDLSEDECYVVYFASTGRKFERDFQGNVNIELSELIRNSEK